MVKAKNIAFDMNSQVVPYYNGFKIIDSSQPIDTLRAKSVNLTIAKLLQLTHCVYFSNIRSETQIINDTALEACGYDSLQDAEGKTIAEVATPETAMRVINSHQQAMQNQNLQIFEDDILRKDNLHFQCISLIKPWYDLDNEIIGIFGCSIILQQANLIQSLQELTDLGLMNTRPITLTQNGIYFSKREMECIRLFLHGKTAKESARALNLSPRTIEHYLENIKNKVGVTSKQELISYILEHTDIEF